MNAEIKKITLRTLVVLGLAAAGSPAYSQDLFDDSFLSPASEEKSVTVKQDAAPVGMDVLKNTVNEANTLSSQGEAAAISQKPQAADIPITFVPGVEAAPKEDVKTPAVSSMPVVSEAVPAKKPISIEAAATSDLSPSEKIVGRVPREVFKEMADLETENSLLNLQIKKEELKKDIYKLKLDQRQILLDEIQKRELAARSKVEWEEERELKALELWEKKQKAALIAKQVKDILEGKIQDKKTETAEVPPPVAAAPAVQEPATPPATVSSMFYISEIRGTSGEFIAKLVEGSSKKVFFVQKGSMLPSGHQVYEIARDHITVTNPKTGEKDIIGFSLVTANPQGR